MAQGVEATITLDVFGPRGAFLDRAVLGGDAPIALSIGSASKIRIEGEGILPTHGHVALLGTRFYAASVSASQPLIADGREVPARWQAYELPCTLVVGEAFIHVHEGTSQPASSEAPRSTPAVLPSTLKDPWAIIARAPNVAQLRVPIPVDSNRVPMGWSTPLSPVQAEEERSKTKARSSSTAFVLGVALGFLLVVAYFVWARTPPRPALIIAAQQAPPEVTATTSPAPSASPPRMPRPRKPMRKHRR